MQETRVLVETGRTTGEETTSYWFDLPIDVAEFEEKLGVGAESQDYRIIEKAIIDSSLGIMPENNGEIIRIGIPPLTEERRKQLAKQCKGEGETAKVSVRNARRDAIDALKKSVKDGLAEDAQKGGEEKLQKIHDKYIKQIDDMLAAKDKEIMTV